MREQFLTDSLESEGFIPASKKQQLLAVANHNFKNEKDLVVLVINPKNLIPELKNEALETKESFPHIYGALNLDAVVEVIDFPCNQNGSFDIPENLRKYK